MRDDLRHWVRRDQAARHARRAAGENGSGDGHGRTSAAGTEATQLGPRRSHPSLREWDAVDSETDDEMAAFLERHPFDDDPWDRFNAEPVDEDEEMTSSIDDEDEYSRTSFHRAAIWARDQGMIPPFGSDLSTNEEMETVTNRSISSDDSTESGQDSDVTEQRPAVQRLTNRPARIVIDSDDESGSDSSSEEEEEDEVEANEDNDGIEEDTEDSSSDDSTPSPPRPAAVKQARMQMHRGRRGNRGGGRPQMRN